MSKPNLWNKWLQKLSPAARLRQESLARRESRQEEPAWHVLFLNDIEPEPCFQRFGSLEAMRRFLIEQRRSSPDTYAVPIFGIPAQFSEAATATDRRYLLLPNGKVVPLFDPIEELRAASSYHLGEPDTDLTPVVTSSLTGNGARSRGLATDSFTSLDDELATFDDEVDGEETPEIDDI